MSAWVIASASRKRTEGASACFHWLPCQYAAEAVSSAPKSATIHEMYSQIRKIGKAANAP